VLHANRRTLLTDRRRGDRVIGISSFEFRNSLDRTAERRGIDFVTLNKYDKYGISLFLVNYRISLFSSRKKKRDIFDQRQLQVLRFSFAAPRISNNPTDRVLSSVEFRNLWCANLGHVQYELYRQDHQQLPFVLQRDQRRDSDWCNRCHRRRTAGWLLHVLALPCSFRQARCTPLQGESGELLSICNCYQ